MENQNKKRIQQTYLIVADNAVLVKHMREKAKELGWPERSILVFGASAAMLALRLDKKREFTQVMIADTVMPGDEAIVVLQRLQAIKSHDDAGDSAEAA